jgi:hypothetical protein
MLDHGFHVFSEIAWKPCAKSESVFFGKIEASKLAANQQDMMILQPFSCRPIQSTNAANVHSLSSKMEPKNSIWKLLLRYLLSKLCSLRHHSGNR